MKTSYLVYMLLTMLSLQQTNAVNQAQTNADFFEVKGRVVLFDWTRHALESTFEEDFIVRLTVSRDGLPRYVRVVYPGVAFLAPEELKAKYRLNQQLFIGRGVHWVFRLREPQKGTLEQDLCKRSHNPVNVTDELGPVQLPAYFPTPGALDEKVPPLASLPCFVMTEHPISEKYFSTGRKQSQN